MQKNWNFLKLFKRVYIGKKLFEKKKMLAVSTQAKYMYTLRLTNSIPC